MILVDTSVWVDHLRAGDAELSRLLADVQVLTHPFIVGEIALGNLARRRAVLGALRNLPVAAIARDDEVHRFIQTAPLHGMGIGYVDAHLLAAARLSNVALWTRDQRLANAADTAKVSLHRP